MQVGIPVAYSVCKVKPYKIKHWICVHREDFVSCDGTLKYKLKVELVIGCAHPITNPTFNLYFNTPSQLKILSPYTYPMVYFTKFYFTYTVSNWDPNLHFMSQFM